MVRAVLPINLTAAFSGLGDWAEAAKALARCDYDRAKHRGLLAMEKVNHACLALGRDQPHEADGNVRLQ